MFSNRDENGTRKLVVEVMSSHVLYFLYKLGHSTRTVCRRGCCRGECLQNSEPYFVVRDLDKESAMDQVVSSLNSPNTAVYDQLNKRCQSNDPGRRLERKAEVLQTARCRMEQEYQPTSRISDPQDRGKL